LILYGGTSVVDDNDPTEVVDDNGPTEEKAKYTPGVEIPSPTSPWYDSDKEVPEDDENDNLVGYIKS
jgi:hypothetical protein